MIEFNISDFIMSIAKDIIDEVEKEEKVEKNQSLEDMKNSLKFFNEIVENLQKEIKKEEDKKNTYLIEKKTRKASNRYLTVDGKNKGEHSTSEINEVIEYKREVNKTICRILTNNGIFKGEAVCHEDDKYNEEIGMTLAYIRARQAMYTHLEDKLVESTY